MFIGHMLHLFLALVGKNTFQLLLNLTAPQEPADLSYTQVIEKLTAHYKPKPLKIKYMYFTLDSKNTTYPP